MAQAASARDRSYVFDARDRNGGHRDSAAEEAVLIPGATVFKQINPLYPILAKTYPVIGIHFHDDDDPQVVDYSQHALAADHAILDGVEQADIAVRETDGKVVVIGESMGSMVASRLAVELANRPMPPRQTTSGSS